MLSIRAASMLYDASCSISLMTFALRAISLWSLPLLVGCASLGDAIQTRLLERQLVERDYELTQPGCTTDRECEVKWAAARAFVLQNSETKLQTVSSDFLETFNPPQGSPGLGWRVTREPYPTGEGYRIVAKAWCANMFGCVPDAMETMMRFNRYVTDSWVRQ